MTTTFRVDDVKPATDRPPTRPFGETVKGALVVGGDLEMQVVETSTHALLGGVHRAFAEHRPLVLSPDVVWLTIAQGVAQHIRLNAEALRSRLVRHDGKKKLVVGWNGAFPTEPASIAEIVKRFREVLGAEIGDGRARLLTCDFSTTTDVERTASEIILLDAFSPFFDLELRCVCGIPEITLTGTVDDWRAIRTRIDVLTELCLDSARGSLADLRFWTSSLAPIADRLVAAAAGQPDAAFFRELYKPKQAYGAERITGWIARLYPYLKNYERAGCFDRKNPLLELSIDFLAEDPPKGPHGPGWYNGPSITSDDVPPMGGSCFVSVTDDVSKTAFDVVLEGGVLAVQIDHEQRVVPRAAWTLRKSEGSISTVLADLALRDDVVRTEASGESADPLRPSLVGSLPTEINLFHERFGGVRLFVGKNEWRVRGPGELDTIAFAYENGARPHGIQRVIDLPDGTCIAIDRTIGGLAFLRVTPVSAPPDEHAEPSSDHEQAPRFFVKEDMRMVQVVSRSLAPLLTKAMATGGAIDMPSIASYWDELFPFVKEPPAPQKPLLATLKGIFTGKKTR